MVTKHQVLESLRAMFAKDGEQELVSDEEIVLAIELVNEGAVELDSFNLEEGVDAALCAAADKLGLGDL